MESNNKMPQIGQPGLSQKNSALPEAMREEKIATTVTKFKDKVEEFLLRAADLATLEIRLPVEARLRHRMKTIKEMGAAKTLKIEGEMYTRRPKMHISNLQGRRLSDREAEIKFSVHEMDDKGDKKPTVHHVQVEKEDGTSYKKVGSVSYEKAFTVTERIKFGEPIEREVTYFQARGEQ